MNHEKKAKYLSVLWLVSYVITGVISQINALKHYQKTGIYPFSLLSSHQLSTLAIVIIYFLPLLFLIRYYAKRAAMKKIKFVSTVLIAFFLLWALATLVITVFEFFNPGTFR